MMVFSKIVFPSVILKEEYETMIFYEICQKNSGLNK